MSTCYVQTHKMSHESELCHNLQMCKTHQKSFIGDHEFS